MVETRGRPPPPIGWRAAAPESVEVDHRTADRVALGGRHALAGRLVVAAGATGDGDVYRRGAALVSRHERSAGQRTAGQVVDAGALQLVTEHQLAHDAAEADPIAIRILQRR